MNAFAALGALNGDDEGEDVPPTASQLAEITAAVSSSALAAADMDTVYAETEEEEEAVVQIPRHLSSRPLYTNPVCVLTAHLGGKEMYPPSMMVITWLTAINNTGMFIMSMNKARYSAFVVLSARRFCLSVPTSGMEQVLRTIGSQSGYERRPRLSSEKSVESEVDTSSASEAVLLGAVRKEGKAELLGISLSRPGWAPLQQNKPQFAHSTSISTKGAGSEVSKAAGDPARKKARLTGVAAAVSKPSLSRSRNDAVLNPFGTEREIRMPSVDTYAAARASDHCLRDACCHMVCSVLDVREAPDRQHYVITAQVETSHLKKAYWQEGKLFMPSAAHPPYLSFLGSTRFAEIVSTKD